MSIPGGRCRLGRPTGSGVDCRPCDEWSPTRSGSAGAVGTRLGGGPSLAAPTIMAHGSDDLRRRLLRPTLTGEVTWCQLFSEPGAGSDLAGLQATAVRDGDQWIVNGQKVWNTSADHADMGILVARSDWDAPKHRGLTYYVLDMHQPGVEVRPIRQMNDHSSFNEVFLNDVRIPHANVVGDVGGGWAVARGTLAHERSYATNRTVKFAAHAAGRVVDEARIEAAEYNKTYVWYPQRQGRLDLVVDRAQTTGRRNDPVLRDDMAAAISLAPCGGVDRQARPHPSRARSATRLGRLDRQARTLGGGSTLTSCAFVDLRRQRHAHRQR